MPAMCGIAILGVTKQYIVIRLHGLQIIGIFVRLSLTHVFNRHAAGDCPALLNSQFA